MERNRQSWECSKNYLNPSGRSADHLGKPKAGETEVSETMGPQFSRRTVRLGTQCEFWVGQIELGLSVQHIDIQYIVNDLVDEIRYQQGLNQLFKEEAFLEKYPDIKIKAGI